MQNDLDLRKSMLQHANVNGLNAKRLSLNVKVKRNSSRVLLSSVEHDGKLSKYKTTKLLLEEEAQM